MFTLTNGSENIIPLHCNEDISATVVRCTFLQKGIYKIINLKKAVTTVIFDRLTDSKIYLPEHVNKLIISSSVFDNYEPCNHLMTSYQTVIITEDQDLKTDCVSKIRSL